MKFHRHLAGRNGTVTSGHGHERLFVTYHDRFVNVSEELKFVTVFEVLDCIYKCYQRE
jgi:hypothetical protein